VKSSLKVPATVQKLFVLAQQAQSKAYAPYSKFQVGASVRSGNHYFLGANVENASYGATICAEQSAVVAAASAGFRQLEEVLVITPLKEGGTPCGRCLQVLQEFMKPEALVWIANNKQVLRSYRLRDLLPASFGMRELRKAGSQRKKLPAHQKKSSKK
jgi:cytidine deaminase